MAPLVLGRPDEDAAAEEEALLETVTGKVLLDIGVAVTVKGAGPSVEEDGTVIVAAELSVVVEVINAVDGIVTVREMLAGWFSTGQILLSQGSIEQQPEKPPSLHW